MDEHSLGSKQTQFIKETIQRLERADNDDEREEQDCNFIRFQHLNLNCSALGRRIRRFADAAKSSAVLPASPAPSNSVNNENNTEARLPHCTVSDWQTQ